MKKFVFLAAFVACILTVTPAYADNLTGTKVAGDLSIDGSADAFSPIVETIGPGSEFSYVGAAFTYTANFTDNLLIITDTCNKPFKCAVALSAGGTYALSFFDQQFANDFIVTTAGADGLDLVGFRTARDLTLIGDIGITGTSTFAFLPIPTPEPGSVILLGTGILGVAGTIRRRLC
jgi:PEP-CTERM motif